MTIRCIERGGEKFHKTTLQCGPDGQAVLGNVCANNVCEGRGRIIHGYITDRGKRRLQGTIEVVDR